MEKDSGRNSSGKAESHHTPGGRGTTSGTTGEQGLSAAEGNRTRTLEALCILSFVGSGGGLLLWLICGIFFPHAESILRSLTDLTATQKLTSAYFLIFSLFFAISLSGVILMWRGKMVGFPIYIAAQVMIVSWPMIMLGKSGFSSVSLIFSLLFVILYAHEMVRLRRSRCSSPSLNEIRST